MGGGNLAGQAAVFFANYAAEVKVLVRGKGLIKRVSSGVSEGSMAIAFIHRYLALPEEQKRG